MDGLRIAAAMCLLLAVVLLVFGGARAFWYDEIFTLGAATQGPGPDWAALQGDVHPPTYPLLVSLLARVVEPTSPWIRLVNLPALLATIWGFAITWRLIGRDRTLVFFCVFVCSLYVAQLALDLRAYALLLGFGLLGHAALLHDLRTGRPKLVALILSAMVLTALHHFGAAIGLSLLGVSALLSMRRARLRPLILQAGAIAALSAGFLFWIVVASDTLEATSGRLWITGGLDPWLDFIGWQVPLFALLLVLLVYCRAKGAAVADRGVVLWMLLPGAIVTAFALVASLYTPVISVRNLAVLVPGLAMATVVALPEGLVAALRRSWAVPLFLLLFCLRYGDTGLQGPQRIDWAVRTAMTPECGDAPVLIEDPGIVETYARSLFSEGPHRPYRELAAFDGTLDLPPGCTVIALGWHKRGTRDEVAAFFAGHDIDVEVLPPPDRRLAASPKRTSGYVVILR